MMAQSTELEHEEARKEKGSAKRRQSRLMVFFISPLLLTRP